MIVCVLLFSIKVSATNLDDVVAEQAETEGFSGWLSDENALWSTNSKKHAGCRSMGCMFFGIWL